MFKNTFGTKEVPDLLKVASSQSEDTLALSTSSFEFEDFNLNEKVDLISTTIGSKPPTLPLREERLSLGTECVFKAKGVGWNGVRKNSKKIRRMKKAQLRKKKYLHLAMRVCFNNCGLLGNVPENNDISPTNRFASKKQDLKALSYQEYLDYLRRCSEKEPKVVKFPYLELELSDESFETTGTVLKKRLYTRELEARQEAHDSEAHDNCRVPSPIRTRDLDVRQNPSSMSMSTAGYTPLSVSQTAVSSIEEVGDYDEHSDGEGEEVAKNVKNVSFAAFDEVAIISNENSMSSDRTDIDMKTEETQQEENDQSEISNVVMDNFISSNPDITDRDMKTEEAQEEEIDRSEFSDVVIDNFVSSSAALEKNIINCAPATDTTIQKTKQAILIPEKKAKKVARSKITNHVVKEAKVLRHSRRTSIMDSIGKEDTRTGARATIATSENTPKKSNVTKKSRNYNNANANECRDDKKNERNIQENRDETEDCHDKVASVPLQHEPKPENSEKDRGQKMMPKSEAKKGGPKAPRIMGMKKMKKERRAIRLSRRIMKEHGFSDLLDKKPKAPAKPNKARNTTGASSINKLSSPPARRKSAEVRPKGRASKISSASKQCDDFIHADPLEKKPKAVAKPTNTRKTARAKPNKALSSPRSMKKSARTKPKHEASETMSVSKLRVIAPTEVGVTTEDKKMTLSKCNSRKEAVKPDLHKEVAGKEQEDSPRKQKPSDLLSTEPPSDGKSVCDVLNASNLELKMLESYSVHSCNSSAYSHEERGNTPDKDGQSHSSNDDSFGLSDIMPMSISIATGKSMRLNARMPPDLDEKSDISDSTYEFGGFKQKPSSNGSVISERTGASQKSKMSVEEVGQCISFTLSKLNRIHSKLDDPNIDVMSCDSQSTDGRDALYFAKQSKTEIAALANILERQIIEERKSGSSEASLGSHSTLDDNMNVFKSRSFGSTNSSKSMNKNFITENNSMDKLIYEVNDLCSQIEDRIDNIMNDTKVVSRRDGCIERRE